MPTDAIMYFGNYVMSTEDTIFTWTPEHLARSFFQWALNLSKLSLLNLVFHTQYQFDFLTPVVMFEKFLHLASCKNPPNKRIRDIQNSHYYEF